MGRFGLKFRERSVFLGTWKKGYSRTANREVLTLRWWTQRLSYVIDFVLPHCRFFLSTQGVPEIRNNVSQLEGKLIGDWRCSLFKKKERQKENSSELEGYAEVEGKIWYWAGVFLCLFQCEEAELNLLLLSSYGPLSSWGPGGSRHSYKRSLLPCKGTPRSFLTLIWSNGVERSWFSYFFFFFYFWVL